MKEFSQSVVGAPGLAGRISAQGWVIAIVGGLALWSLLLRPFF